MTALVRRRSRRAAVLLIALVVLMAGLLGGVRPAWAAGDSYDRFDIAYTVGADGVTHVEETIVLRFGPNSGRHGYDRTLVTRELYDDAQDMVFEISNLRVTSPSGVSTETQQFRDDEGRERSLRIRIGDANRTIRTATATYVISYDLRGALRTFADHDEFYWDALGPNLDRIRKAAVTVSVPGGAREVNCFAGAPQTKQACTTAAVEAGAARFTQDGLDAGDLLTVGVKIASGQVAGAGPILVERADAAEARQTGIMQVAGGVGAALVALLGFLFYRRRMHDDRFAGIPPGTFPVSSDANRIVANDEKIPVPVAFAPPKLPLSHAGYILDGGPNTKHLTATLIGLAVNGAIQLNGESSQAFARDARRIPDQPGMIMYHGLFESRDAVRLDEPGDMDNVRDDLYADAHAAAAQQRWFKSRGAGCTGGLPVLLVLGFMAFPVLSAGMGPIGWFIVPVGLALAVTAAVVGGRLKRGLRTATGRAWADQIEGFRTYIATAEAEQLKFEEGEDIFSRYLPWAVLFGLAERWVQVCERAVQLGLLNEPDPGWYGGSAWDTHLILWNLNTWDHSVATASTTPAPASSTDFGSSTGFGGGSSFGGGGFSGGGGGGGGGGSW